MKNPIIYFPPYKEQCHVHSKTHIQSYGKWQLWTNTKCQPILSILVSASHPNGLFLTISVRMPTGYVKCQQTSLRPSLAYTKSQPIMSNSSQLRIQKKAYTTATKESKTSFTTQSKGKICLQNGYSWLLKINHSC